MRHTLVAALSVVLLCGAAAPTAHGPGGQVCPELDTGKIDTTGDPLTVTVTAPEGYAIARVCVKAGSAQQGDGPEFLVADPAATTLTVGHSSGKAVSHWSASFVPLPDEPDEPVVPQEPTEPEPTPGPTEALPVEETEQVPAPDLSSAAPAAEAALPVTQTPAFAG